MAFVKLAEVKSFEKGMAISVETCDAKGKMLQIAVISDEEGKFYAIDDLCTHADVPLSEGEITSNCVQCWAHGAEFNLTTGEGTMPAVEPVRVYPIRLEGNDILVDVDQK